MDTNYFNELSSTNADMMSEAMGSTSWEQRKFPYTVRIFT